MSVKGFKYREQKYRFIATFKDGKWEEGILSTDSLLHVGEGSSALNYGQQCFEGLKAYRTVDGEVNLFRPDMNWKRMNTSCDKLCMPNIPKDMFINACVSVVKANMDSIPEYGSGGSLYLRPLMFGSGHQLGVGPSNEYTFVVFCSPVGAYFEDGFKPVSFCTTDVDRAAASGTGNVKVGGNYAASLKAHEDAVAKGYKDCIYLDPTTHTKIEEVGAANFFGITANNEFVTPFSSSILPSITKYSLMEIASKSFNMEVIERDCYVDKLDEFVEVGACGTAAVITPIDKIEHKGKIYSFSSNGEPGEVSTKLYNKLINIQYGVDNDYPEWILKVSE